MLDVVVRANEPINPTSDTASSVHIGRGGSGANIAAELASSGIDVSYVGAVGNDTTGTLCANELTGAGVATNLQLVDAPTGVVVCVINDEGQRAMMTDRGANSSLSVAHALAALDQPFDHLHVSGYCVLDDATRGVAVAALGCARELGRTSSIDVCSVGPLRRVSAGVFLGVARDATMVFANEEEAMALSGQHDVQLALEVLGATFREVIVTRGAQGALARVESINVTVPSMSQHVLDTTGAGDAATGAYLAARLRGRDVTHALGDAMRSASNVVGGLGSRG